MQILSEIPAVLQSAAGEVNGASWGPWRPRMARRSNGNLVFAFNRDNPAYETGGAYGPGPDNDPWWQFTHLWYLQEFNGSTWSEVANPHGALAISGREPPLLLLGPGDELYVFGWPNRDPADPKYSGAYPCLYRESTGFTPEPISGDWIVSPVSNENWSYLGGSINAPGRVVIVQAIAAGVNPTYDVPGAIRYAWATPVPGQPVVWQQAMIPSSQVPYRAEISYPLQHDSGMTLFSGIATTREEQGLGPAPAGSWDYIENGVLMWQVPVLGQPAGDPVWIKRELIDGSVKPQFYPFDAYVDGAGLQHLLVEWDSNAPPDGRAYVAAHVLVQPDGSFTVRRIDLPYTNLARMTQDLGGRFYFIALYNGALYVQAGLDGDVDGTQLGPVLQGARPFLADGVTPDPTYRAELKLTGSYPAGQENAIYTELAGAPIGRGGTRGLSNELNILWCRYDYYWSHLRLQLSTATPVPVPVPVPVPQPSDVEARLTALETWKTSVAAALQAAAKGLTIA